MSHFEPDPVIIFASRWTIRLLFISLCMGTIFYGLNLLLQIGLSFYREASLFFHTIFASLGSQLFLGLLLLAVLLFVLSRLTRFTLARGGAL
jgi:hypothetical protein